ncbi:PadR family transcriptional regulator [Actinocrispum wychmicini]|uniref:PadR family transcriptional regulator n=2 Tax=Actinocrispum wychmicini TaxID=1213861 RepID=A0A4R2JG19_9PSEU|nr:PadR family transcriptional regulator [Actinocrispum wychmicini]
MTVQTLLVLQVLLAVPDGEIYGLDVIKSSDLPPGTVYPLLQRLLDAGWVTDRWESLDPTQQGRPPRRYYRLTPSGVIKAQAALSNADRRRASLVRLFDTSPRLRAEES